MNFAWRGVQESARYRNLPSPKFRTCHELLVQSWGGGSNRITQQSFKTPSPNLEIDKNGKERGAVSHPMFATSDGLFACALCQVNENYRAILIVSCCV